MGIELIGIMNRLRFFTHPRRLRGDPSLARERGAKYADKR